MNCSPGSDRSFGPRVTTRCRSFDFTLQFEDIIFACLPATVFIVLAFLQIAALLRAPIILYRPKSLLAGKLVALTSLSGLQLAFLALRAGNSALQTKASLAADILSVIATGVALTLSFLAHQRSLRPSTLLSVYLSTLVILGTAKLRTLWLMAPGSPEAGVMAATFALTVASLLTESVENRNSKATAASVEAPERYSGFWNRTVFAWLAATFRLGYLKIITLNDLPPLDTKLESSFLRQQLASTWMNYDPKGRHTLLRACFRTFFASFSSAIIPRLCLTAFTFSQPFLITTTVNFVEQSHPDKNYGRGLIGAWAFVYLGMAVSKSIHQYQHFRFITRVRGGLIALVYERTLKIRAADQGEITAVALMSTDVQRIVHSMQMLHEVWASLLDVALASWLLERQLSLAFLAPILLILVFIAATSKLSAATGTAQRQWIEKVQERLRATSAMLGDMKAVKMLGLSGVMSSVIQRLRIDEIQTSKSFRKLLVATILLSLTPMNLAPVFTLGVYTIISVYWKNESLFTAQAFTSIALVALLTSPVIMFIQGLPTVVQSISCFDRIQEYCNYNDAPKEDDGAPTSMGEKSDTGVELTQLTSTDDTESSRLSESHFAPLSGQSFGWNKSGPAVLKNLDLEIQKQRITAVIGPVGCGKTALLNSLLGEIIQLPNESGQTLPRRYRTDSVAYCSQEPWLENKTIRDNIIGVSLYDSAWYNTVRLACALTTDFEQLEKGDRTRVGSKGLNLSGGQKQRIALARAVYSKRKIIFIDDAFSGMDAHTVEAVSLQLFGKNGILRKLQATVIMTTHNQKVIDMADNVVVLADGQIVETGSPSSLRQGNGYSANMQSPIPSSEPSEHTDTKPQAAEGAQNSSRESLPVSATFDEETDPAFTDLRRKNGDMSVYLYYVKCSGYVTVAFFFFFLAIWIFCIEFSTIWVKFWSEANTQHPNKNVGMYMGVYAMIGIVGTIGACICAWIGFVPMISRSAAHLHSDLLRTTLRAPFRFFATTDNGELLNRFSQDMELIDMDLPSGMINYLSSVLQCGANVVIIAVFSKYLGIAIPFFGIALYFLQRFYLKTSRQVRFLGIEARAPLYTHFGESESGSATIRAFGWQSTYQERNYRLIDMSQRPEYLQSCIQHCLGFVLDMMVTVIAVVLVATVVTWRDRFSAGSVGVSLVQVVGFGETLSRLIHTWTSLESSIGAVARVRRFVDETESEEVVRGDKADGNATEVPIEWPHSGAVEFDNVVAAYGPGSGSVLRGVSLSLKAGQHIAICGRTGSGKSSLILSLLQMIDVSEGRVAIDGVELSTLPREDVRSRINVVPQDPFLLPGTVRFNIDPQGNSSDREITHALERVRLWTIVEEQGGLDSEMDVAAWSVGQKQLLCFARAMVKKCKILVLDEAMSSVDDETENTMQHIIDEEFKDCTVMAVMHRLRHVGAYDMVALVDAGRVVELDEPAKLLATESRFSQLYSSSE